MDEARFLRKKVKAGRIDAHPTQNAIIVNYEVTAEILTDAGEPMVADAKRCTQNIRVNNLSSGTDIDALASKLMEACSLITPSKFPELVQILTFLLRRSRTKEFKALVKEQKLAPTKQGSLLDHSRTAEVARVSDLDKYMDLLYEDLAEKVRGTSLILQVAQNPDNLEEVVENEAIMGALARVLREDGTKSRELGTNIIHVFFILSSFTDFHHILKQYKIGNLCLATIVREIARYDEWQGALTKKLGKLGRRSEEAKALLEKYNEQCFQQESLLFVAAHLLLNLAEDTRVQIKMKNKGIVGNLIELLERDNVEFLILIVNFLKKLSIFAENKDEMKQADVVQKLVRLVQSPHDALVSVSLGLLLNLSFDKEIRARIVEVGLVSRLTELVGNPDLPQHLMLGILYHLSMEPAARPALFRGDLLEQLHDPSAPMEMVALWVNLALDPECAERMCVDGGLNKLVATAIALDDSLIMKVVHNLSGAVSSETKELFLEEIEILMGHLMSEDAVNEDTTVEVLGVVGNIDVEDFDYRQLLEEYNLLEFINERLLPSAADDDVVIRLIMLVGTCLADEESAELVARSGVVENMMGLLETQRRDDPEIALQILYVFYKLLFHRCSRSMLLKHQSVLRELVEFMSHPNAEIKRICNAALDIVVEVDDGWAEEIRARRFEAHNAKWVEAMQGEPVLDGGYAVDRYPSGNHDQYGGAYDVYDAGDIGHYGLMDGDMGDHLDFDASQYHQGYAAAAQAPY
mmetsp:Transcript_511/g.1643  ORF Transcript_511/g.1643 Transcript_511/m.1643 type:complete len:748 (+) Transcript_511:91-2334(+)